jgi:hypothetical protein
LIGPSSASSYLAFFFGLAAVFPEDFPEADFDNLPVAWPGVFAFVFDESLAPVGIFELLDVFPKMRSHPSENSAVDPVCTV